MKEEEPCPYPGITPLRYSKAKYTSLNAGQTNTASVKHQNVIPGKQYSKMNKSTCETPVGECDSCKQCCLYKKQIEMYKQRINLNNDTIDRIQKKLIEFTGEYEKCKEELNLANKQISMLISKLSKLENSSNRKAEKENSPYKNQETIMLLDNISKHYKTETAKLNQYKNVGIKEIDLRNLLVLIASHIGNIMQSINGIKQDNDISKKLYSLQMMVGIISQTPKILKWMYGMVMKLLKTNCELKNTHTQIIDVIKTYKIIVEEAKHIVNVQSIEKKHTSEIMDKCRTLLKSNDIEEGIREMLDQSQRHTSKEDRMAREMEKCRNQCQVLIKDVDEQKTTLLKVERKNKIAEQRMVEYDSLIKSQSKELADANEKCSKYEEVVNKESQLRREAIKQLETCKEDSKMLLEKVKTDAIQERDTLIQQCNHKLQEESTHTAQREKKYRRVCEELAKYQIKEEEWLKDRHRMLDEMANSKKSISKLNKFKKEYSEFITEHELRRQYESTPSNESHLEDKKNYEHSLSIKEKYIGKLESKLAELEGRKKLNAFKSIDNGLMRRVYD